MVDNPGLYRDVLDTIYDGVYFLDRQRKIFFWNKGAERITGYRAADVMGRSCADDILCHVDKQGRHLCREGCPAADVLNDGQRREAEVYLLHKNGYRKPVRIRVAPIEDAAGRLGAARHLGDQGPADAGPAATGTTNVKAYETYLLGREQLNNRTRSSIESARDNFRRAVELDPEFAPAYAYQAIALLLLSRTAS